MSSRMPRKKFRYTNKYMAFLREAYREMSAIDLTKAFNTRFGTDISVGSIKGFLRNHKIRSGRTGRFEKGHESWNVGTKGYTKGSSTSFKKGHMPASKKLLWSERISRDGYIEISVPERNPHTGAPTRYRFKHVFLYEAKYGPVPKGHVVIFKDGNRLNCVIENLLLVTRAELLVLNLHNYRETHKNIQPSVLALARLEAKAGIRTRPGRGRKVPVARGGGDV